MTSSQPRATITSFSYEIRRRCRVEARHELDSRDESLVYDCLVMRLALLYDLAGSHSAAAEHWRRTLLGLSSLNVESYTSDWKVLREIVTSLEFREEFEACAPSFKHWAQGRIHNKWILGSAIRLMEETSDYGKLNQWVVFDSRVNLQSLDLSVECCTEYLNFEESIVEHDWPSLPLVQRCAKDMFGDFVITNYPFRPRHGNGATAEVERRDADSWHKNRHFAVDGEIINYLRYRLSESEWRDSLYMPYRGLSRESILVCVPKSTTKNRTISKEPTTLQYLQQDIYQALDDYFIKNLSSRIDLHDQGRSRCLALQGSADGSYATIDLSSASDSVSVRHVESFFDGLPILYPILATRSSFVHVRSKNGEVDRHIRIKKFAPMGSSVTFPLECMVFAILCEAAVRLETGRRSRPFDYVVYGDDIIIKSHYAMRLTDLLSEFDFKVNPEKSFIDDGGVGKAFREACGIEAYGGEDITPLRLSRRLVSLTDNDSDRQAGLGVGIIDLLNRTYLFGFKHLHRWINDQCATHHWFRRLLRVSYTDYCEFASIIAHGRRPWINVASPFVITDDLHNTQWCAYGFRNILNSPCHQREVKAVTAKTRKRAMHYDSNDYYSWCVGAELRSDVLDEYILDATGIVTLRSRDLKWSKTWVPIPFGTPPTIRLRPAD